MSRWLANIIGVTIIAFLCFAAWGGYLLESHLLPVIDSYSGEQTLKKMNQSLDTVNNPKWGTLYEIDQSLKGLRLTIDAANKVAIHEQHQLTTVDQYASNIDRELSGLSGSSTRTLDALTTTAKSATGTLTAAQTDLATLNGTIVSLQPLESNATATVNDFDALLKSKSIYGTLDNVNALTANMNGIANDGRRVTDKLTDDFVTPKPWYRKIIPSISDIWDFSALAARHTP